jgi:hypothetical protein
MMMASSLAESAKVEATRMKNLSEKADKLSKMISNVLGIPPM